MVDKKILREMSQDVLVIPFTEEMAEKLDKFCRIQIENIEQNKVEKLIMSFLTRKNDKELEMAFNKYATESEQTIFYLLPYCLYLQSISYCWL